MKKLLPLLILIGCVAHRKHTPAEIVTYKAYSRNVPYKVLYVNDQNKWTEEVVQSQYWIRVITVKFRAKFIARIEKIQCLPSDSIEISVDTKYNGCSARLKSPEPWNSCTVSAKNY